eukprot:TRINITY_DN5988_c0_g1_i1.p1 TRINITY_DN5988_c0_g1~~TRINITY_DN5988_c0_g1_i1.p1  ORF type:complete len:493 (+),score=222.19 TRINITY_DN5988_c0_g1_i1:51-1529(+)
MKLHMGPDPLGFDALLFSGMSDASGIEISQVRFLTAVFGAFPLCFVHSFLPYGTVRHLYSIFWGLLSCLACFREDSVHPLLSALLTYVMILTLPAKVMPKAVMLFTFVHMTAAHMYAYMYEYMQWNIDYTMAQMILVVKLQMLAYNVADGTRLGKVEFNKKSDHERDAVAPSEVPNFLEFWSYVLFYPTFIAGPCFTYKRYAAWQSGAVQVPPGAALACFWKFLGAIVVIVLNKAVAPMVPSEAIVEPLGTGNPSVLEYSMPVRLLYIWVSVMLVRTKYFLVWYLSDAACILSGFGYNGKTKKDDKGFSIWRAMFEDQVDGSGNRWDGCSNGNYFKVELASNIKGVTDNWNVGVNNWLKNCIYFRLAEVFGERSQVPVLLTQVMSAFWHGLYPGYYLFFVTGTLLTIVARNARAKLRPYFQGSAGARAFYDVVTTACTGCSINNAGVPFVFLDWKITLAVWSEVFFAIHVGAVAVYVLCLIVPKKKAETKKE